MYAACACVPLYKTDRSFSPIISYTCIHTLYQQKHGLHHVLDIAKLIYKTCFVIIINVTFLMDNPFLIQSSERLSPYRRLKTKTSMLV